MYNVKFVDHQDNDSLVYKNSVKEKELDNLHLYDATGLITIVKVTPRARLLEKIEKYEYESEGKDRENHEKEMLRKGFKPIAYNSYMNENEDRMEVVTYEKKLGE